MTKTTEPTAGTAPPFWINEPFQAYAFDVSAASTRTDTPDLMAVFREVEMAEGYREMDAAALEAHDDLYAASLETFSELG